MTDAGAFLDPVRIDPSRRPRTISFENPEGSAGSAGASGRGRKGSPSRTIAAGERVVLADIDGPGIVGHFWLTVPPMRPERLRAIVLEMYYDGSAEPSVAVPLPDFFGAVHGRPVAYASALQSIQEGRGFNSWIPMPFRGHLRVELTNHADREVELYYQFDLTVGPVPDDVGLLHASFRRQNPTVLREDFVIADRFTGPGRFLGCNVGVRVLHEPPLFTWYGEGEVKMYLDDDDCCPRGAAPASRTTSARRGEWVRTRPPTRASRSTSHRHRAPGRCPILCRSTGGICPTRSRSSDGCASRSSSSVP